MDGHQKHGPTYESAGCYACHEEKLMALRYFLAGLLSLCDLCLTACDVHPRHTKNAIVGDSTARRSGSPARLS
jgi:hypothetical protein